MPSLRSIYRASGASHAPALIAFATFSLFATGGHAESRAPKAELPDGLELVVVAAPPLVTHPIMGCLDDRGRLFVGDAAGLNLNREGLEEQLPNRVLMLEDTDGDGGFDKSTVFADRMTFPQGGCWLDGSLYVASPPGIWKLTDTDDDGVADQRVMIVGGFDYDGNAADVHGPFLHPNGRLYWCHGRKGHKVVQQDGTLVHEGKASGIWSCRPDGSDVQWHSLGSMDNPVEVDFTPEGDILGVVNLYYNQPRGDTLVHWLYGGVYERSDQLAVIAGLPRTTERMPVVHNYGHVAVAGSAFYRSGALNPAWKGDMFVTFFNTQKLVRTKLTRSGATFSATEHEFLKIDDPDVHLTDVIEDADGSLLVLDTGGWFRIGCPTSITEKPDFRGAIYRVRKKGQAPVADPYGLKIRWDDLPADELARLQTDERWRVRKMAAARSRQTTGPAAVEVSAMLDASRPQARLRACEAIALSKRVEPDQREALHGMLDEPLDPALEHAAIFAGIATSAFDTASIREAITPRLKRRLMIIVDQSTKDLAVQDELLDIARKQVDADDPDLARAAVLIAARHPRAIERSYDDLVARLAAPRIPRGTLDLMAEMATAHLAKPPAQELVAQMLVHSSAAVRQTAWRILARQSGKITHPAWLPPVAENLARAIRSVAADGSTVPSDAGLPLLLDVVAKLDTDRFDRDLQSLVSDTNRLQPIRLKALSALFGPGEPLDANAFALLVQLSQADASPTTKVDAARLLARARLNTEQMRALAPLLATAGPVEVLELLKLGRGNKDPATGRMWAESLVQSPVMSAIEESAIKTAFSSVPPEIYEAILEPAVRNAAEVIDAKSRKLEALAADASKGSALEGAKVFASSSCVACHKVGEVGRHMGPDLSLIGKIRQPRDLLESILFPDATIAREYETHVVETSDGETYIGMIKSVTPEALVLLDVGGQEKILPHAQVVTSSQMPASLMPMGLEQAFTDQQLLDLVAWLLSLK